MSEDLERGFELGRIAYDAYIESTGGRSLISGVLLPEFAALPQMIQVAWSKAGIAVALHQAEKTKGLLTDGRDDAFGV